MKLVKLKAAGIRGFNDELTLDFEGKLVIYSGPNASGKTSIGEAIEWLLYGRTIKRIKGDEISKREYSGSYRNTHYHGPVDPFVEAHILDTAGMAHIIRRELDIDESSKLFVDGNPASDLHTFGIGALYDRPLILQHTLQDFIFMRPKTRYEVLSAMLGLEPLVNFRNAVEAAKTEFQNNLPPSAVEARNRAVLTLNSFRSYPLLQPILAAANQGNLKDSHKHLVQLALGRVAPGTQDHEVLSALEQAKAAKERAKLDWGHFSLNPLTKPESHPALTELASLEKYLKDFTSHVGGALLRIDAPSREEIPTALRLFYQQGLELVDSTAPEKCPFCLHDTLTPERLADLHRATELIPEARAPLSAAQATIESFRLALLRQWQQATKLIPSVPTAEERQTIEQLVSHSAEARGQFFSSCDEIDRTSIAMEEREKDLERALKAMDDALKEGRAPNENVPSLGSALESYSVTIRSLPSVSNGYAASYASLDPLIRNKLASEADVRFLGILIDGLKQWPSLEISREIDRILDDLQDLIRQARQFIEIKQKQILGLRDQEIKGWYQLLTGAAQVGYAGMTPGTDNLELKARTFAKGMMAAPNLSSSQLNCIGLAVYMATCGRKGSPFKLILFDDPIQSMDDEHTEAFKKQAVSKLLSLDFQVIVFTHMAPFADAVELLYRDQGTLFYKLEAYTESGLNVSWKGPEIKKLLSDVRKNKDSQNEGYRNRAVQALRQLVERFVKDIFVGETRESISRKYEDKAWPELRGLLRRCVKFDPADEADLEDTHNFTSPYLHTDETLPQKVPSPHQMNPHYECMKRLIEKYSDTLQLV